MDVVEVENAGLTQVTIAVELFGQARRLTGRRQVRVIVPWQAGSLELVAALAQACPELIGPVILEDCSGLQKSYTFNLNGTAFVADELLQLQQGDSILLFSSQAGG